MEPGHSARRAHCSGGSCRQIVYYHCNSGGTVQHHNKPHSPTRTRKQPHCSAYHCRNTRPELGRSYLYFSGHQSEYCQGASNLSDRYSPWPDLYLLLDYLKLYPYQRQFRQQQECSCTNQSVNLRYLQQCRCGYNCFRRLDHNLFDQWYYTIHSILSRQSRR